ncbi:hypothetical protein [Streptomyces sp. NPDC001966]
MTTPRDTRTDPYQDRRDYVRDNRSDTANPRNDTRSLMQLVSDPDDAEVLGAAAAARLPLGR